MQTNSDKPLATKDSQLSHIRGALLGQLSRLRVETSVSKSGSQGNGLKSALPLYPECCFCSEVIIREPLDIHEIIFTRGDVRNLPEEVKLLIHDHRNCGFVHRRCHADAETTEGYLLGITYLLKYEGIENITAFMEVMKPHFKVLWKQNNMRLQMTLKIIEGKHDSAH